VPVFIIKNNLRTAGISIRAGAVGHRRRATNHATLRLLHLLCTTPFIR